MNEFVVSARKYRPATFDSVVGQASIVTTLKNAIKNNHLAQAYLFCGPRGVGKTTCARLLAKAINCEHLSPSVEPCNACESCISFNEQRSFNIHELDAASNNSVEDIRLLTEKVRIPPQTGKYSLFIIDEVHMLSASAFNAFLKTLEEPPAHAIFILATTEKHKIIPTILSRCQIFDFNRITTEDISRYLASIAEKENIRYEPDALTIIAQKADGAMRDALSIFDQVVSFSDNHITYKKVIENLNVLDYDYYFRLVEHFLSGNYREALLIFNEILLEGFDAHNFIVGLANHLRDLLVCQDKNTIRLLDVGEQMRERYLQQAKVCSDKFIFEALAVLNQCDIHFKSARNQRLHVEITLLQLCRLCRKEEKEQENTNASAEPSLKASPQTNKVAAEKPVSPSPKKEIPVSQSNPSPASSVKPPVVKSFSLKDALKETAKTDDNKTEKEEETNPDDESEKAEDIDIEKFNQAFQEFLDTLKNENARMYTTLQQQQPEINFSTVTFTMTNKIQCEEFHQTIKPMLIRHLRRRMGAVKIDLQTRIADSLPQQKLLYTDEEKYKYLLSKNPNLEKLRQKMNLDFE